MLTSVSDYCCLSSNDQFVSNILAKASYIRWDDVHFILDQHPYLGFIVLAHRNNSHLLDRSLHWDTLFWFRLLLNATSSADNHKFQYLSLWFTRPRFEPTIYQIRSEHADHYIDVGFFYGKS